MGVYITSSDVTAEGVTGFTASQIDRRIVKWEAIVERLTRNVFRVITPGELTFNGTNMKYLHFSIPIITVTSLKINSETIAIDPEEYRVYNGRIVPQDHRQNPKIELTGIRSQSIFVPKGRSIFAKGYDQKVTGTWGFVEADGTSTPEAIKAALIELVIKDLEGYFDQITGQANLPILTAVRREKTDDHEIEYMDGDKAKLLVHFMPRDIYDLLMMYRAPMKVAVPDNRIFLNIPEII